MGPILLTLVCGVLISSTVAKPLTSQVPTTSTLSSTTQEVSKETSSLSTEQSVVTEISHHESKTQPQISDEMEQAEPSEPAQFPVSPEMPTKDELEPQEEPELVGEEEMTLPERNDELNPLQQKFRRPFPPQEPVFDDEPVPIPVEREEEPLPEDAAEDSQTPEMAQVKVYPQGELPINAEPRIYPFPENSEGMVLPDEAAQSEERIETPEAEDERQEEMAEPEVLEPEQQTFVDRLPSDGQEDTSMMEDPNLEESESPESSSPNEPMSQTDGGEQPPAQTYEERLRNAMKEPDEEALRSWGANSNMVGNDFVPEPHRLLQYPLFYKI